MSVIEMKEITKEYEMGASVIRALRGVDLTIEEGEFLSIAGPSGSGKTTCLNIIGCLDTATRGDVLLNGESVGQMNESQQCAVRRENLGFIFQSYNLIPVLTAAENVSFVLSIQGRHDTAEIARRTEEMLVKVGLKDYLRHRPNEMSGGQQQRVAIARALVKEPSLVLADEPTANLDSATGDDIMRVMEDLNRDLNVTFVFSTHDRMVMDRARRLVMLHDGDITSDERR
jgi:putative ABC transport system ATP-binding protein